MIRCSTWNTMKYVCLLLIICYLTGCNKPDSTPETSDEIYKDLLVELDLASKGLEAETKNLVKLEAERDKVVPQTGQIKFATRKVNETQATLTKLSQQKQFFEIKLELRKNEVRERYTEARKGGRKWPDPVEITSYQAVMKLQREKLEWDKNKGKKKDVPHGTEKSGAPAEPAHH